MSAEGEGEAGAIGGRPRVGLGRRTVAALIDNATWFFGASLLLGGALASLYESNADAALLATFALASLWFNYFTFCEWRWGQTIGKNAAGIEVISVDGADRLSFHQASIRNLLRLVDFFVIGWVLVAGRGHRRLGDRATGTAVVKRPRKALGIAPAPAPGAAPAPAATGPATPAPPPPSPAARVTSLPPPPLAAASGAQPPAPPPGTPPPGAPPPPPAGAPVPSPHPPPPPPPGAGAVGASFPDWVTWGAADAFKGLGVALLIGLVFAPLLVLPFDPDLDSDGALLGAQALLGATLIGVAVWGATKRRFRPLGEGLRRLGVRAFSPSGIGWMFVMLFGYYAFAILFAAFVLDPQQEDIGEQLGVGSDTLVVAITAVVLIVGLAPLGEELFFRGFLYGGLRTRMSFWPAVLIAGLVFGAIHAPTGITTVIPLAVLGGGFCWLYEKTGSIWPCVIAHMINNGIAVAAAGASEGAIPVALPLL